MKGQGSVEYLVIFAAVLIIAVIIVFLLGQFAGFSQQSLVDQSITYWSGQKPIAISDWSFSASGNDRFVLVNRDITKIEVVSINTSEANYSVSATLSPGDSFVLSTATTVADCDAAGDVNQPVEQDNVVIYYRKPSIDPTEMFTQTGTVPIRGVCAP